MDKNKILYFISLKCLFKFYYPEIDNNYLINFIKQYYKNNNIKYNEDEIEKDIEKCKMYMKYISTYGK